MEKEEYLSEERYQRNNKKVNKTGKILLIVGIIVFIIGGIILVLGFMGIGSTASNAMNTVDTYGFDNSAGETAKGVLGSFGLIALGGFINFVGTGLLIAGGVVMIVSHRREITAYTTQQVMPVAQEGSDKMAPTIGHAAGEIAKGIKQTSKKFNFWEKWEKSNITEQEINQIQEIAITACKYLEEGSKKLGGGGGRTKIPSSNPDIKSKIP